MDRLVGASGELWTVWLERVPVWSCVLGSIDRNKIITRLQVTGRISGEGPAGEGRHARGLERRSLTCCMFPLRGRFYWRCRRPALSGGGQAEWPGYFTALYQGQGVRDSSCVFTWGRTLSALPVPVPHPAAKNKIVAQGNSVVAPAVCMYNCKDTKKNAVKYWT